MKLERWHCQIKYEEAGGTVMKRMDKTISLISKAIEKKLLSRIIGIELTPRIALIRKRHKTSLKMRDEYRYIQCIEKHIVTKTQGESIFIYGIEKVVKTCQCTIRGVRNAIFAFIPSRVKHQWKQEDLEHSYNNLVVDVNYNEKHGIEKDAIVSTLRNVSLDAEIQKSMTEWKTVWDNVATRLKNATSVDKVRRIKRSMNPLKTSINSSFTTTNLSGLPVA
ncbi:uncharacterized protein NPIL_479411 [Nephila pilipes]|uniref:Uncharacterized protein n=1 Tax=Nephila pilipes TaxID=299642 RepID=A0A8X6U0W2_NEPPI|nr:uncharacterized protein NPIL_479411 [Nephila pilipes]